MASSLLYETEDKLLQNKLDSLWIRLSDVETVALSKQARFVRAVSVLTNSFFDAFLGHKLVSARSLGVSACLSMASLGIVCWRSVQNLPFKDAVQTFYEPVVVILLALAVLPFILRNKLPMVLWSTMVLATIATAFAGMHAMEWFEEPWVHVSPFTEVAYDTVFLSLTIISDSIFIVVTRWIVRKFAVYQSGFAILGAATGNLILAILLVVLPFSAAWGRNGMVSLFKEPNLFDAIESYAAYGGTRNIFLMTLAGSNLLDAVVASVFFGFYLLLLFHRILWPAIQRPVYALANRGIVGRRKFYLVLGFSLLGLGTSRVPLAHLLRLLKKIFETLLNS